MHSPSVLSSFFLRFSNFSPNLSSVFLVLLVFSSFSGFPQPLFRPFSLGFFVFLGFSRFCLGFPAVSSFS